MSNAAQLISEALVGLDSKSVVIGGKSYEIKAPTIKTMCLGLKEWAKIELKTKEQTNLSLAIQGSENAPHMLKGVSYFIAEDSVKAEKLYSEWMNSQPGATEAELNVAVSTILGLMDSEVLFTNAQLALSAVKIIARPK